MSYYIVRWIHQKCTSKGIWRQGIVSKHDNSLQKSLCPVVMCPYLHSSDVRMVGSHIFDSQNFKLRVWIPESLPIFTSKCSLKIQISEGLGPFSRLDFWKLAVPRPCAYQSTWVVSQTASTRHTSVFFPVVHLALAVLRSQLRRSNHEWILSATEIYIESHIN